MILRSRCSPIQRRRLEPIHGQEPLDATGVPVTSRLTEAATSQCPVRALVARDLKAPKALIVLALLSVGGYRPDLPGRNPPNGPRDRQEAPISWPSTTNETTPSTCGPGSQPHPEHEEHETA